MSDELEAMITQHEDEVQAVVDSGDAPAPSFHEIYPLTVFHTRYNGLYEGGMYVAFNEHFYEISPAAKGDDTSTETCRQSEIGEFYNSYDKPIGRGKTPNAAAEDLLRQLVEG